jgi:hypothetical protein
MCQPCREDGFGEDQEPRSGAGSGRTHERPVGGRPGVLAEPTLLLGALSLGCGGCY